LAKIRTDPQKILDKFEVQLEYYHLSHVINIKVVLLKTQISLKMLLFFQRMNLGSIVTVQKTINFLSKYSKYKIEI